MNYFLICTLLTAITSGTTSLFIIFNSPKTKTNRYFAYYAFFVALWGGFQFLSLSSTKKTDALLFMQLALLAAIFICSSFFHFTCHLTDDYKRHTKTIRYLYIFSFIISPFVFTPLYIFDEQPRLMFTYWPIAGKIFILYVLEYVLILWYSLHIIYQKLKTTSGQQHQQLKYIFYGILIAYIGGATNFPICYYINLPPYGDIFIPMYCIFIAYAIFKYQLMDIKVIIQKSLVYTILITIITIFYLISIFLTEHILQTFLGYKSLFVSMISATFIALAFIPLRNFIQNFIEKTLFKGNYIKIAEENELLRAELLQSERMRSIAILASGMAHEIKNPLTPIKTFSETLPSKINDKEFLLKFSKIISKEVDRIDSLVQDLLSFAKPSPPQLKSIDINHLIEQTLDLLNNEIIRHQITSNIFFENKNTLINIDPNQMKQVLLNIFLNAIDAMPNGGILTINSRFRGNDILIVEISDTGCGINSKDINHIFDPFFTKKDHGTGLGLSITHEIIKNHNGRIFVESTLGKGTTFRIELPV